MKDLLFLSRLLFLWLTAVFPCSAQNVIFSENMGTSGAGSNPLIPGFSQFQNSGCTYSFAGTGNVSSTSPSAGYTGASGGNNVFLNTNASLNFVIGGINTLGFSSISLSYGLYNNLGLSVGAGLNVEVSTNNVTYTALTRAGNFWIVAGWLPEQCTGTIPATQNLYLRFTNTSTLGQFRIDDVVLSGVPTASTNPSLYNGWPGSYTFSTWPASGAAGTFPPNMVFHYGAIGVPQPVLSDIVASGNYVNPYNIAGSNTCLSLISGQGASGVSFVNRDPGSSAGTGNLGEAVVALNTTCRSSVQVAWQAGTLATNNTIYQLRAQYRIGTSGTYTNLPNSNVAQIRYTSQSATTNFGPIVLPSSCDNQPVVQVRWAYYWAGTGSGTGDEIFLTNINISSINYPPITSISNQSVCGGKPVPAINFSATPAGATFSWTNSNTNIGLAASGTGNIATYTSPAIASPPDRTGLITLTASIGTCTSTSSFSITIKGPQASSVWTGGTSTNWFDHANWSNCVCSSITSATVPAITSPSFNPVISGTVAANVAGITLSSGASLSVQSTQSLNVYGSWSNSGTFSAQQGFVMLNGSSAQSIGGTAATQFYNLTLNNAAGASLGSAQSILGSLQLNAGTFNTANLLTLAASASGTGRIGPISPAADIINQVTVQQYAPGGSTGWALLGEPISSSITMNDWDDNFVITCQSCPSGSLNGFTSIYSYNETIAGSYSFATKYIPITSLANTITNGVGYWVYLGNGNNTTTAIPIDVTGTVAKSSCITCGSPISLPVSRTSNTSAFDDGWNLLSNPLPSPISWTLLRNGNSSVDNALYVYNADLGGGNGAYATYINGVSSNTTGGITDTIPMCQGFYVHASASTALVAGENIKLNGKPVFLKSSSSTALKPIARLILNGANNYNDMSTFYFEQGGSVNFQTDFDAYKLVYDYNLPYLGSMSDSLLTAVNGLPDIYTNLAIPVKAITALTDSFSFSLITSNFPANTCITLFDAYTNITTNLLTSAYSCLLVDTTTTARFTISFVSNPLMATSTLMQPDCANPANGTLTAVGNTAGPWDYVWRNGSSIIKTSLAKNSADTLLAAGGANYSVKINTTGQCDNFDQDFIVNSIVLPAAGFSTAGMTAYLSLNGQVSFINTSTNSQLYAWDFGDGSAGSALSNPVYNYASAGNYTVLLVAQSSSGCSDSSTAVVAVVDDATLLPEQAAKSYTLVLYTDNVGSYLLGIDLVEAQDVILKLYDANGRILEVSSLHEVVSKVTNVDLENYAHGIYYLNARMEKGFEKTFKLVK